MLMRCWRLRGLASPPSTGIGAKGWISSGLLRQALADRHGRARQKAAVAGPHQPQRVWAGQAAGCCGRGQDRWLAGCCLPSPALKGVGGTCSGALLQTLAALDVREQRRGAAAGPHLP